MNRIVKIILILIVAFFLILGVIWLIGRNTATKNGKQPLTFRQFLGLSTKANPTDTLPGENTSDFNGIGGDGTGTNGDGTTGNGTDGAGTIGIDGMGNVNVSQFTNGTSTPASNGGSSSNGTGTGTNGNGDIGVDGGVGTVGGGDGSISIGNPGDSGVNNQPVCSDEDLNIEFTPAQLAQLNILQSRFYTLAQTLHSDTDVQTELANHDAFSLKATNALALYNYCQTKLPAVNAIADRRLKLHIPTPFWHAWRTTDPDQDSISFIDFLALNYAHMQGVHDNSTENPEKDRTIKGPYGLLTITNPTVVPINGSALKDTDILVPVVEKILRLNLW